MSYVFKFSYQAFLKLGSASHDLVGESGYIHKNVIEGTGFTL